MGNQTDLFYNRFSVFYPLVDIFLRPQKQRLFREINRLPSGQLLEIGVGDGKHLPLYKKHHIVGIDTSIKMLEAATRHQNEGVDLLHMNGEKLIFPGETFEYVVLSHVIAVVDNPERLLQEIYRVLKPGGQVFILNHFTPDNWLKYIDKSLGFVSKIFHFKSVFYVDTLIAIKRFSVLQEIKFGRLSYFKLLIYRKP